MDSFEFNKIAGACLAALLAIFGTRTLMYELNHEKYPPKPGYIVEVASVDAGTSAPEAEAPAVDMVKLVENADVASGEKLFKRCSACHTNSAGAPNRVGPNLHGIADRDIASTAGFGYSAALEEKDGAWTVEALDGFLADPKDWAKGTKMAFAGMKKPDQRADMIKYLQSLK